MPIFSQAKKNGSLFESTTTFLYDLCQYMILSYKLVLDGAITFFYYLVLGYWKKVEKLSPHSHIPPHSKLFSDYNS